MADHVQGPNAQSIVASGMTVEQWQALHPSSELGPDPEDIEQVTTHPPNEDTLVILDPGPRGYREAVFRTNHWLFNPSLPSTPEEPDVLEVAVSAQGAGEGAYTFIFTTTGGTPPYSMTIDAGEPFAITSPYEHDFVEDGTFALLISDSGDPEQTWTEAEFVVEEA